MTPTKDERRIQILQAALGAFSENGYAKTTMDDIVKRSELSKGTLYWYFHNKQKLFIATIEFAFQDFDQQLSHLVKQEVSATERLRTFFVQAGELICSNKQFVGFLVDSFFQAYQIDDAMETMRRLYQNYITSVETIIQQGIDQGEFREVDPHTVAISLMAGGDGVALYVLIEPDWNIPQAYVTMVDLILRGLQKE